MISGSKVVISSFIVYFVSFQFSVMAGPSKIILLEKTMVPQVYKSIGTIHSRDEIELSSRITSRVTEMLKRSGDSVKKGDTVVKLDDLDLKSVYMKLEANILEAKARLKLAAANRDRDRALFKQNTLSEKLYDQAEEAYSISLARLAALEQELKSASIKLSYATINSPIDGIISETFVEPGDMAAPSKVLITLFNPERLMLYAHIRESLVNSIKIGDNVSFNVASLNKDYTGVVKEIVPSVVPDSRTFLVKICIESHAELMPGMFGMLRLIIGHEEQLLVPENYITRIGQLEFITVQENGSTKRVMIRSVPAGNMRRVISGKVSGKKILPAE